jgi:ATP phosphoribosyltransferase
VDPIMADRLRIALPNKGRLAEGALALLDRAGLEPEMVSQRALRAEMGTDFTALFVRAGDIPEFIADGAADLGITGSDLVVESGRTLERLANLGFGRCRLVVAARDGVWETVDTIPPGTRIATSFPRTTAAWFEARGQRVELVPVSGAAEVAPHLGVADVIADIVGTGSTLKVNGLRELATIAEAEAVLVARPTTARDRRAQELVSALESVVRAEGKRYLMANVPRAALPELKRILPGLDGPTVVDVMNTGEHVAAHAVVDQADVYRTIADLKRIGARGILITRIERLMP